jgi:multidrug efflux pump subunit AcrA (membrane-fusion protein)
VNSPEALDTIAGTTTIRAWIALAAIGVVIVVVAIWAFVGTIPQEIETSGVLSAAGDTRSIPAGAEGSIDVSVQPNAMVKQGDTLATVNEYGGGSVAVVAPVAGRVQDVLVAQGAGVEPADSVLVLVPNRDGDVDDRVVTYLSASEANDFDIGDEVRVELVNPAQRAPIGMTAKVIAVAETPSTVQAIATTLRSEDLARAALDRGDGAAYRVDLQLDGVAELPDDQRPVPGQIVSISNTYARPHPIELLFGNGS